MCEKCLEICNLIGELLQNEGGKLTIYSDSPDFDGNNNRVDFKYDQMAPNKVYFGESVLDCLKKMKSDFTQR